MFEANDIVKFNEEESVSDLEVDLVSQLDPNTVPKLDRKLIEYAYSGHDQSYQVLLEALSEILSKCQQEQKQEVLY